MEKNKSFFRASILGISFLVLVCVLALKWGSVSGADLELITQLRLPRVLLAIAVGAGLSVAGAVLQALFSNPLCEPYTLGVSSGSAIGAIAAGSLGFGIGVAGLSTGAFAGALIFAAILYFIARKVSHSVHLLLAGVMLGFLGSSLVALWMALSDPNGIQGAFFWLLGDLSRARLSGSLFTLVSVFFLSFTLLSRWRDLDALLLGEEAAQGVGLSLFRSRRSLILTLSFLVGICVSSSGMIGFIGLMVPHFARHWVGSLHLRLLPITALWGAVFLVFADLLSRVFFSPYEIPVGVLTSLIGAPLFVWMLLRRRPG